MPQAEIKVPRVEERLKVGKQTVADGLVTVSTQTTLLEDIVDTQLDRQSVEVCRVPFDVEVQDAPQIRTEGNVTIVPILEERLVKRLFLVEEVHIHRQITSETQSLSTVLKKQTVTVERKEENREN